MLTSSRTCSGEPFSAKIVSLNERSPNDQLQLSALAFAVDSPHMSLIYSCGF